MPAFAAEESEAKVGWDMPRSAFTHFVAPQSTLEEN